ncbi:MAG TPA: AAA family ATPase [Actinomycetota bacterium]|nr:AAA family ATPase [Actinomycetota bacterium]
MDNSDDLRLLLASRYPLIIATEREETRLLAVVRRAATALRTPVYIWSCTRGLGLDGGAPMYDTIDPTKALAAIEQISGPAVFVLVDAHHPLADPLVVRRVKELSQHPEPGRTIVATTPQPFMPPEIEGIALAWALKPPSRAELHQLAVRTIQDLTARGIPVALDAAGAEALIDALRGLSLGEAERLIQKAAFHDGKIDDGDVTFLRGEKAALLESSGSLELIEADHGSLADVGGLDALKAWLAMRGRAFEPAAKQFGLTPPRGVLITGVPGCGKSMIAKTLARSWGMPLVLLDASRLYGPYVGETEQRTREALARVESMAPVVLWVDEIEKGFPTGDGNDGGVSKRMLGTFLRWMQDRDDGVFIVATANQVTQLPPELLRKGRFDEIFFVDLPEPAERADIVRLHLTRRGRDPQHFDVDRLAALCEGFSGAEIEAAIVAALYRAYAAGRDLHTGDVAAEVEATSPLSVTRAEEVAAIRAWSQGRAVPASGASAAARTA